MMLQKKTPSLGHASTKALLWPSTVSFCRLFGEFSFHLLDERSHVAHTCFGGLIDAFCHRFAVDVAGVVALIHVGNPALRVVYQPGLGRNPYALAGTVALPSKHSIDAFHHFPSELKRKLKPLDGRITDKFVLWLGRGLLEPSCRGNQIIKLCSSFVHTDNFCVRWRATLVKRSGRKKKSTTSTE